MASNNEADDLLNDFLDFEEQESVFDIQVGDIPIWERVRGEIFGKILKSRASVDSNKTNPSRDSLEKLLQSTKGITVWLKNIYKKNPYFASQHDYLFWGHQRRQRLDDGLWWDIYFDHLYDSVNIDYLHVEQAFKNTHRTPAKTEPLRYIDLPVYSGKIISKLLSSRYPLGRHNKNKLENLSEKINQKFNKKFDLCSMVKSILAKRRTIKPLFSKLLSQIRPKVVVLTGQRETFTEVCKEKKIPVVEVQHGIIHPYNLHYNYPGYRNKKSFADHLFVYGEYWKKIVDYPIPDDRIHPVGYPHVEIQSKQYMNNVSDGQIVFLSQPVVGQQLSQLAIKLSEVTDRKVVYKLHPFESDGWEKSYKSLNYSDVLVVTHDPPLYELLSKSSVQVGVSSTVLFEGLNFGLDTYLYDQTGFFLSQLDSLGIATRISSARELYEKISKKQEHSYDTKQFFVDNSIERMENALSNINKDNNTR